MNLHRYNIRVSYALNIYKICRQYISIFIPLSLPASSILQNRSPQLNVKQLKKIEIPN